MTIAQIKEKSGLSLKVAESLYWKSIWLRSASPNEKISWIGMLRDKKYRICMKRDSLKKH